MFDIVKSHLCCLSYPIEKWDKLSVCLLARECMILHNCCDTKRMAARDINSFNIYKFKVEEDEDFCHSPAQHAVEAKEIFFDGQRATINEPICSYTIISDNTFCSRLDIVRDLPLRCRIAQKRWEIFYDSIQN